MQVATELGLDKDISELTDEQRHRLLVFLDSNKDVFAKDISELGHSEMYSHQKLQLRDASIAQSKLRLTGKLMKC